MLDALIDSLLKGRVILSKYLHDFVVGIDVSSDFSIVAMLAPEGDLIRKPFRIDHNPAGFEAFLKTLKNEEERLKRKPIFFVESTGIFHLPLFFFLRSNDLKGFVLNPLCVHSTKNFDLRKVKNDKKDALAIAKLAKYQDIKVSLVPEPEIISLRMLSREYFALADNLTDCKLRFMNDLRLLFPGFLDSFKDPFTAAALDLLKEYPSPKALMRADYDAVVEKISKASRRSIAWATEKLNPLFEAAKLAKTMGLEFISLETKLRIQIQTIESLMHSMDSIENAMREQIDSEAFPLAFRKNIHLLDAMPGIGFITAITLIAEMGDFTKFRSPKAFAAFFGVDPSVNESGKFKGDLNRMSKRGTKLGRRVLFIAAMASIRTTRKGEATNAVLRDYYQQKITSKKKKVALVAVMHKLLHYIFAVLRDQKPFEIRSPEDHWKHQQAKLRVVA